MAPVLKAVTETVHLVQGGAVNWTLVTDDTRGHAHRRRLSGRPRRRAGLAAATRVPGRRRARHPADARPHRPPRFGDLVRQNPRHPGLLSRRRGRPRQARVSGAGIADRRRDAHLAAAMGAVDRPPRARRRAQPRGHPHRPAADRRGGRDVARPPDGHPDPRPHRRPLLVSGRRRADQRRRAGDRSSACWREAARNCCPSCSATIRTAASAAWPRWRCWTPRFWCPAMAICGAARSARPPNKRPRWRYSGRRSRSTLRAKVQ